MTAIEVIAALEKALEAQPLTMPGVTFVEKADLRSLLDAHASALRDAEKLRKALTTLCRHFPTDADMVEAGWDAATVSSACDAYDSARAAALDDNTKGTAE